MPIHIDESWEYWVGDPEITEILAAASAHCPLDSFGRDRDRRGDRIALSGIRFGWGDPDGFWGRLAPRKHTPEVVTLQPVECRGCGTLFQPDRQGRKYCSIRCVVRCGRDRDLPETAACATCGILFCPRYAAHRYCGRWCSGEAQRVVVPEVVPGVCQKCGIPLPPSSSRNQKAQRLYCSKKCKHAATSRRARQLAGGLEEVRVGTREGV